MGTIVAFDRKHDLVDCELLASHGLPVTVLNVSELKIAALQCVPGMSLRAFMNVLVALLGNHLRLMASRRLLLETLQLLYRRQRPRGVWPTLSEWIETIERIRADSTSRQGQYREAALFALKGLVNELGESVDYAASDLFEMLYASDGCFVVQCGSLGAEAASFLAGLFVNWIYEYRGLPEHSGDWLRVVVFVMDDALPLVTGSTASESEGGGNPLANWAFMARARGIGFVVAAQNFSLISPAFRNNANTILCCGGSYGRDAEELGRHLSLTREQGQRLRVLQPGEAIALAHSEWPYTVYGRVPEVL